MALCLAESLVANEGTVNPKDLADRQSAFGGKRRHHAPGSGGYRRQGRGIKGRSTRCPRDDRSGQSSPGRSVSRCRYRSSDRSRCSRPFSTTERSARAQSKVTHAAAECLDAAEVLARVLTAGIEGRGHDALQAGVDAKVDAPKVRAVAEGVWRGKARSDIRSSGYVVDTLEAALWSVSGSTTFEEAVLKAVNLGDDADTVGAVTGQIAGAVWGYSGIPEAWTLRLAWSEKLVAIADALWNAA